MREKTKQPESEPQATPEPAVEPAAEAAPEPMPQPFETNDWHGHTQHQCLLCPWDTLRGEDYYWLHYAERHALKAPPPQPKPLMYDRFGNVIE